MSREIGIDLYCGCGGMSAGAKAAIPGLTVRWALDRNEAAASTFKTAFPGAVVDCADVAAASVSGILDRTGIGKIDWFFAGPTCQAVSTMGIFNAADPRNALFVHFARLLRGFVAAGRAPETIILENVPGVVYGPHLSIVRSLFDFLGDLGYFAYADVLNLATLGLPQLRHRFFLIATRSGRPPTFPQPTHTEMRDGLPYYVSVRRAIGDLYRVGPSADGSAVGYRGGPRTNFQKAARGDAASTANHWFMGTTPINLARIATVPQGGSWKDIPIQLLPDRFQRVRMTDYATLYGRLHEDNPAYTISAGFANVTSGCFTHPIHDRPLSIREGARLQGFSDDFEFAGFKSDQYRLVGNAVPPLAMAKIISHLRSDEEGVRARITSETLATGRRLPPMTKRFQTKRTESACADQGYGGGTHWPVGWGAKPRSLPTGKLNWRKDASEPRTLRADRRLLAESFAAPLIASVRAYDSFDPYAVTFPICLEPAPGMDALDVASVRIVAFLRAQKGAVRLKFPFSYLADRVTILIKACREAGVTRLPDVERIGDAVLQASPKKRGRQAADPRIVLIELKTLKLEALSASSRGSFPSIRADIEPEIAAV